MAFGLVGLQQGVGPPPAQRSSQLPAQIHRILDAGVHTLAANRRMHVCGVAGDEHVADAVTLSLTTFTSESRHPPHVMHSVVAAGDPDERIPHVLEFKWRVRGRVRLAQIPCDESGVAVAVGQHKHQPVPIGLGEHRRAVGCVDSNIGQHDVGPILRTSEGDSREAPHRVVRPIAAHHVAGVLPAAL